MSALLRHLHLIDRTCNVQVVYVEVLSWPRDAMGKINIL